MTLQKIAENLDTSLSYESMYERETENKPWLSDLLDEAYQALAENIKYKIDDVDCIDYKDASTIMDKALLTLVTIYDKYLAELERNLANATP